MRALAVGLLLVVTGWSAHAASVGFPIDIAGPREVMPNQPATYLANLAALPPGTFSFDWNASGHAHQKYLGQQAAQTFSWATSGPKTILLLVSSECGSPLGLGFLDVFVVPSPSWSDSARVWPDSLVFAADSVAPAAQTLHVVNVGGADAAWHLSTSSPSINYSPSSGTGSDTVTVTVDRTGLAAGSYTFASQFDAPYWQQTVQTTVNVGVPDVTGPFGEITYPASGASAVGSQSIGGWSLDSSGVASVTTYYWRVDEVSPVDPNSMPVLGDATFVEGAKPDVATSYRDYPQSNTAAWSYTFSTNTLPGSGNDTIDLYARVTDTRGNARWLGPQTIHCDNGHSVNPFGDILTPPPGGAIGPDSYESWAWVLTPPPQWIPTDGSTINVFVDGVNLGHPTYSQYRSDIAALFPGYANSNGAAGYLAIDATSLPKGQHTILWTAVDNAGNADGIGSRYFWRVDEVTNPPPQRAPVRPEGAVWGSAADVPLLRTIAIADPGKDIVTVALADHIPGAGTYAGYTVHGDRLGPLPVGSTLDPATGVFAWQPGPAFAGTHVLEFWRTSSAGEIDSARFTFRLGSAPPVTRRLHRARRTLGGTGS
jgi:hypothetical protein